MTSLLAKLNNLYLASYLKMNIPIIMSYALFPPKELEKLEFKPADVAGQKNQLKPSL